VDSRPPLESARLRQHLVSISVFFIATQALRALSASIDRLVPRSFPVSCRSCVPSRARGMSTGAHSLSQPANFYVRFILYA
jgi:hypothetical protein